MHVVRRTKDRKGASQRIGHQPNALSVSRAGDDPQVTSARGGGSDASCQRRCQNFGAITVIWRERPAQTTMAAATGAATGAATTGAGTVSVAGVAGGSTGGAAAAGAAVAARWTSAEAVTALAFSTAAAAPDPDGADGLLAVGGETGVVVLHIRPTAATDTTATAAELAGTRCVARSSGAQPDLRG